VKDHRYELLLHYKKCQLMNVYINNLSQMYLLPQGQVAAGLIIIAGLYTTVVSKGQVPVVLYLVSGLLVVVISAYIIILLNVTSSGLFLSKRFLRSLKKWTLVKREDIAVKKCVRSLQPTKLYMGAFHVVDKGRAPSLVKFCLQRTIFLGVQSRT